MQDLLQRTVLGGLDHVLVGGDVDLDATVLGAALGGAVVSDRVVVGVALGGDALFGDALALEVLGHGVGTVVGDLLVRLGGAHVVSVAKDGDVRVGQVGHFSRELVEVLLGGGGEVGLVEVEEDTAVEGDLDGLEAVHILDGLDLGVLERSQFFGLLVHLLADDGAGSTTHGGTDGGTDGGALAVLADQIAEARADGGAGAGADEGALTGVGHAAAGENHGSAEEHQNEFLHFYFGIKRLIVSVHLAKNIVFFAFTQIFRNL